MARLLSFDDLPAIEVLQRACVLGEDAAEGLDLLRGDLHRLHEDDPFHTLTAWRRRERAVVAIRTLIGRQQLTEHDGTVDALLWTSSGRHVVEDWYERGVLGAFLEEHTENCKIALRVLVDQVELHRLRFA